MWKICTSMDNWPNFVTLQHFMTLQWISMDFFPNFTKKIFFQCPFFLFQIQFVITLKKYVIHVNTFFFLEKSAHKKELSGFHDKIIVIKRDPPPTLLSYSFQKISSTSFFFFWIFRYSSKIRDRYQEKPQRRDIHRKIFYKKSFNHNASKYLISERYKVTNIMA